MKTLVVRVLTLALWAVTVRAGADHDVMQVKSPYVVKYPLGPSMEVQRHQPVDHSPSYRDSRNTNIPLYNRECSSCSTGTFSSSNYGSSGSSYNSGSGHRTGSFPASGFYSTPVASSTRHEVRREQKFVNGQPIYDLHHERQFQDGSLVHEEKVEKDEDDFGVSQGSGAGIGNQNSGAGLGNQNSGSNYQWYNQPAYSKSWEESQHENYTYGYGHGSGHGSESQGSDEFSSNFNAEVARLREQLHRQMGTHRSQIIPATTGSSHRTESHSQTRYVNGQPVYIKKEEKKYQDGKLIHNETEEKGAEELGTANLVRHYDSPGAYIPGRPTGGYYNQREQYHEENTRVGGSQYPSSTHYNGNQRSGWEATQVQSGSHTSASSSLGSSSRQPTLPNYRPASGSSSEYSQEHHRYISQPSYSSSYDRSSVDSQHNSASSSYPSYREVPNQASTYYSQQKGEQSSSYPSHRPYSPTSASHSREESYSRTDSSQSSRPTHVGASTQYTQESRDSSSSYPSYRPSSSSGTLNTRESSPSYSSNKQTQFSSTQDHRTNTRGSSSSYPSHRPVSGSSTQYSQESQENTHRTLSNHPSYRPVSGIYSPAEDRYSTSYSEERRSTSSLSSNGSLTDDQDESSSEDLEETRVLQNTHGSSLDSGTTYSTQVNMNAHNQDSSQAYDQYYRQPRPDTSRSVGISSSQSSTENRYDRGESGYQGYPSPAPKTEGGARTVAVDLSSTSRHGSSLTDQLLGSNQGAQRYGTERDHSEEYEEDFASVRERGHSSSQAVGQHSGFRQQSSNRESHTVGIPGVISGPQTNRGDRSYDNKERYDISPLDDNSPQLPDVGNEIDSSLIPTMATVEGEIDSSDLYPSHPSDTSDQHYYYGDGSNEIDEDHDISGPQQSSTSSISEYSQSSNHYNDTHTRYGTPVGQYLSPADRSYDYSHSTTSDESRRVYPASSGSRQYHYNETRRHSTITGGQQTLPAMSSGSSSLATDCTQISGCGAGSATSTSRRSEIRTSKRYINGQLVGITHYERQYENGKLVHENVTEQGVNELSPQELRKYGIDQLNLVQGSYQPESYSQRHELRQEKKYVNGQQIYDLHHERRFEDGQLVHDNRTEKDENDFGEPSLHEGYPGAGFSTSLYDDANRHEVTQSQHLQQHVTSESRPGSVGQSSQTHQVADASRVIAKPIYTTQRHETRRQQEYINGQPVYDLHHERRFHDGSLVYENRTELDEKELGGPTGGHYDALHQIMSGNTLNTATESTHRQAAGSSTVGSSYSGGLSTTQGSGSYHGSSSTRDSGSYQGSSSTRDIGSYQGTSSSTSDRTHTYGSTGSTGSSLLTSGGSSLIHSGGATTTVLGGPLGTGGSSSRQHGSSSYEASQQSSSGNGGCLTCVLLGGTGFSSQGSSASHGTSRSYSGGVGGGQSDGYNQRREMNREEYYEDGQLVHGQEEDRRYEDGRLIQENRRQYSEIPGEYSNANEFQSAGTSYTSRGGSSGSSSRSSISSSSSEEEEQFGARVTVKGDTTGVCDSNPCVNGGTCVSGFRGPICVCTFGFKGTRCEEMYCPRRFCRYGGECSVNESRHECSCKNGFSGTRCETRSRRHASKP